MAGDENKGMKTSDKVGLLGAAVGLVPGGKAVRAVAETASAGLSWASGSFSASEEMELMQKELEIGDIESASSRSGALKRRLNDLGMRGVHGAGKGVAAGAGSIGAGLAAAGAATAAGAAVGSLVPVPLVGTIAGGAVGLGASLAGGMASGYLYDKVFVGKPHATVDLAMEIRSAQRQGVEVAPEAVFAVMAGSLPEGKSLDTLRAKLKELTGKTSFAEVEKAERASGYKNLTKLMNDPEVDAILRREVNMPKIDVDGTGESIAQVYARYVNAKDAEKLDASLLLFTHDTTVQLAEINREMGGEPLAIGQGLLAAQRFDPASVGEEGPPLVDKPGRSSPLKRG